ncbi:tetratricopeptide repeat protein [Stutzerimonas chloritidismutans]|uniref:tetratricopeptide repeat protein n=1 Tax=Stutzerimonas chloritidismutans TaxID=203192 RepID=UPI003F1868BB
MRPLLLLASLLFMASAHAAQSIDPAVFKALERARTAQDKGEYSAARQALSGAEARAGSLEEALLWRSRAYLAWAEGDNRQALELLEKAVNSGKLDDTMLPNEHLNLAKLNLVERRYAKVVSLLGAQAKPSEEVLQMLVQAYQGLGQHPKALPLAERYVQANPNAGETWIQFLVGANAELKRYEAAERWQRRLLEKHPNDAKSWRQLAGLQQLAGDEDKALATLRAAHTKGLRFSESELDNLVLLAGATGQPWQGAKLLQGMLDSQLLAMTAARRERLGQLWWQARERQAAAGIYRDLAAQSGSAKLWLNVAQLELEQSRWQAGLDALRQAERAGAERRKVRAWREWAEGELNFERERQVASVR